MSGRDLGSLFDEEGQEETPAPSQAPRSSPVDEPLLNDEARQMLEERSRAAREAAVRAAEVAAQKGKELGKAALGALARIKEEDQHRAKEKSQKMAAAIEVREPLEDTAPKDIDAAIGEVMEPAPEHGGLLILDGMGQLPPEMLAPSIEVIVECPLQEVAPIRIKGLARKRSYKYVVLVVSGLLVLAGIVGVVYLWSNKPAGSPVEATMDLEMPERKPADPAPVSVSPTSVEAPSPVEPMVEQVPVSDPVESATDFQQEPAAVQTPTTQLEPPRLVAPPPKAAPIQPRPKKVEAPPVAPPAKLEETQIDQIRDFGKQLEALNKS